MAIPLYMNQHVPRTIAVGLRLRGIAVMTAYEDGASDMDDLELLDRVGTCVHDLEIIAKAGETENLSIEHNSYRFEGCGYSLCLHTAQKSRPDSRVALLLVQTPTSPLAFLRDGYYNRSFSQVLVGNEPFASLLSV